MIEKLEYLLALAREKHFGRAAEACGITQPTFSAGIRALEETLGMPLVERSSRFRGFTAEGERVLEWARRIVGDMQAMRADVGVLKRGLTGLLRIAAIPTAIATLSELTAPYRLEHQGVRFAIQSCTSNEVLRRLENFEVDAGVTYIDNEPIGRNRVIPLHRERYRLLTAADTPLGRRQRVRWAELGQIPLCMLTPDMQNRRILDRLLQNAGADHQPVLESNSILVLVSHVQTGGWACILSETLAGVFRIDSRLRAIPIVDPEEEHAVGLLLPAREPVSPLAAALAAIAQRQAVERAKVR